LDGEGRPEGRGAGTAPRNRAIGSTGVAVSIRAARGVMGALLAVALAAVSLVASAAAPSGETSGADLAKLKKVVNSDQRSAANKARDKYRHPVDTLAFFGIRPNMTVVELWPFGGWYTEILAPYVKGTGTYYAAAMDPASDNKEDKKYNAELKTLLAAHPDLYGEVKWSVLAKGKYAIAPDGTADMVVTFRNIHNWVWAGDEKEVFAAAFRALKPGGILGVEEHRANDAKAAPGRGQAYVGEDYAIGLIESAGFKLVGHSKINNNPKDTKDYPEGVWSLPPSYAEGDKNRAKYAAIGESDRFTLKFVKPAS
jgi:predicted methyltransferase